MNATRLSFLILTFPCILGGAVLTSGCKGDDLAASGREQALRRAEVTEGGNSIRFPSGSPGLSRITSTMVEKRTATIPVIAPARVVASIVPGLSSNDRIVMFDSPDVTSLYSQYRQSSANVARASKNLSRIKDMFQNQAATAKDLNDAENDAATAKASMAESESKLRGLGYNPPEFNTVAPGTAWLICDVPESQLNEVQRGEDVPIQLASFPDGKFRGRADAIGEVVDPVTRTVKVRVSMPNPRGRILPGMFARVDFGDPISGIVLFPASGVVTVEGADYAFIQINDSEFVRRRITIGSSGAKDVIVLKGLADGERVVTDGAMLLKGLSFGY
jgi:multidrug efflux pump subunit AcrA (membrane-fusion protein)